LGGWELGAAGVVLIFFGTLGWPEKFVPAWAVRLGNISFGLYMFHSIALYLCFFTLGRWAHRRMGAAATPVMTVVALALMFGMAVASHRWLEMPFLRLKRRFTVVASKVETADGSVGEPAEGDVRGLTERDAGLSTPSR
jgi:peptidoglycan/LPS O-acetylase OafA/YrhL